MMKIRTWLLLLALMMMPMMVSAQSADATTWDFEGESDFDQFTCIDGDNDGFNWEYHYNPISGVMMETHEGRGVVVSASYDNENSTTLTPDNWLISPEVTLGGVLSFWACGQDDNDFAEVFGVFVCVGNSTNPADFVQVGADKTTTNVMTLYEFNLSQYAGQTGRFAIRHYHCSDKYYLNIDDICLDVNATYIPKPTNPTNLVVNPAATTADVTWDGAEGDTWNLRYKVYNPNEALSFLWDLTLENYQSQAEDWTREDRDGDGESWEFAYSNFDPTGTLDEEKNVCYCSFSWRYSAGALEPDNWLISRELPLGGTFKFWAKNDDYSDVLGVYVITDDKEEGIQIGEDIIPPSGEWAEYTFDTSGYNGQVGRIVIRHYNCKDKGTVSVDYISYEKPGDEPALWIEVNGLTSHNYTIEGLEPGTDYMVEVQAYTEKGTSDWTAPVSFTTISDTWTGRGTEADPYVITNVLQMQKMATQMNGSNKEHYAGAYFVLGNDLDFSGETFTTIATGSGVTNYFSGTFDGQGHSISGINFTTTEGRRGVFGFVSDGGTVKNLTLKNSSITGGDATGGIVARLNENCLVENCHVESNVTISGKNYVGGVVGYNLGGGIIRACSSAATVSGSNYIGGIVGACQPASTVENCFYYGGTVTGTDVGAIVGREISSSGSASYNYAGNLYYTSSDIKGVNGSDKTGAERGYKVTSGTDGLTLQYNDGSVSLYEYDRVTKIGDGLHYKGVYYGKAGGSVNIVAAVPAGTITKLETSAGTLTGTFNTGRLTFANADAVITATIETEPTTIALYDHSTEAADNTSTITDNNGTYANVTLNGRKFYKDGNWNTLCLPFDFTIEGSPLADATIMVLDGESSSFDSATGTLTLNFTEYTEPTFTAGTSCIVKWNVTTPSEVEDPVFNGVIIKNAAPVATTSCDDAVTFVGHYSPYSTTGSDNTKLYLGADNTLYYPNAAMTIGAFRACFQLNGITAGEPETGKQSIRTFNLNFGDDESTAIKEIVHGKSSNSRSDWYTLDGRKFDGKPTQRGIYINNGRKIIIM